MSLVAAEIERAGIPTVVQVFLHEIAEEIRPPRALWVPFDHGYPLGAPNDASLQTDVIRQTFALLSEPGPGPVLKEFAADRVATPPVAELTSAR